MLKITVLTDNLVRKRGLLAEHGLSLWIEHDGEYLLFDTGQTSVFAHNAREMGIDLAKTQAIVISHGHYDHGGGLEFYDQLFSSPRVFVHPDALLPKYLKATQFDQQHRAIGFPWQLTDLPDLEHHLMRNTATMQVGENAVLFSDTPQKVDFEKVADDLLIEKNGTMVQDGMHDEQFLVIDQPEGLTVIVGCSHPGIVNILKYVRLFYPDKPVHTLIGGMHLEQVSAERLQKTIEAFRAMDIKQIIPLHCTGQSVIWSLKKALGNRVLIRCTGETVEVPSKPV